MLKEPLISVVIPVYNLGESIRKTLDSVCQQTYSNLQIIVINDGSSDHSLSICREYTRKDSRIILIDKENEGLPLARQTGLRVAIGAYVHHLDGGDYVDKDIYRVLVNELNKSNFPEVVVFGFYYVKPDKIEKSQFYPSDIYSSLDMLKHIWTTQQYYAVWQYIHKRELFEKIGFDKRISVSEDTWYTSQLIYQTHSIKFLDDCLYYYVVNEDSMSRMPLSDRGVDSLILSSELINQFMSNKPQYKELEFELLALKLQSYATILLGGRLENIGKMVPEFEAAFRRYPQLRTTGVIKRVMKLLSLYARNKMLYHLMLKYYRAKGKIR